MPHRQDDFSEYEEGGWTGRDFTRLLQHQGRVPPLRHLAEDVLIGTSQPAKKTIPRGLHETPITKGKLSKKPMSKKIPSKKPMAPIKNTNKQSQTARVNIDTLMNISDPLQAKLMTSRARSQGNLP